MSRVWPPGVLDVVAAAGAFQSPRDLHLLGTDDARLGVVSEVLDPRSQRDAVENPNLDLLMHSLLAFVVVSSPSWTLATPLTVTPMVGRLLLGLQKRQEQCLAPGEDLVMMFAHRVLARLFLRPTTLPDGQLCCQV